MKDGNKCSVTGFCWPNRSKLVGGVFLIIAAVLTLFTLNGFGILGMFIVGAVLCRRAAACCCSCHCHSSCDVGSCEPDGVSVKAAQKKPAAKK